MILDGVDHAVLVKGIIGKDDDDDQIGKPGIFDAGASKGSMRQRKLSLMIVTWKRLS